MRNDLDLKSEWDILDESLSLVLPREPISVAQYAVEHRWLSNTGGGYVGPWRHDMAPYLVEPMECLTSLDYLTVAIPGPGQSAKTSIAENWFLHSVGTNPAKILWYMQSDDAVEAYVKDRINPMIEGHEVLRNNQGLRAVDDSLHFKRFRAMSVEFLTATNKTLISKSAPRIIVDEIDALDEELGNIMARVDVRRQTYGRQSMVLALSHADKARGKRPENWTAGIMAIYADSDRRVWYWPCPYCGAHSSPAPIAARYMPIEYPEEGTLDAIRDAARLACPVNGCLIEDHHRPAMNLRGMWIGRGQEIAEDGTVSGERIKSDTAGFWIVGAMSQFILGGIGGLARAKVKAKREFEISGEEKTLREVIVKQWGWPYAPDKAVGSVDANDLADRARNELKLGFVPEGVRFLTTSVDVGASQFDYLIRGWGVSGESWIVDRGKITAAERDPATPSTSPDLWDRLIELFHRPIPLADGSGRSMLSHAMGIDSSGSPGVTMQAYAAWKRWRLQRAVRLLGRASGRDMYSIILTKGESGLNAARLQVVYPETKRAAGKVARGEVPIAKFNPNNFKDDLVGQFLNAEPGPWYIHFPSELRSQEAPHVWFEQAVAERKDEKSGRWEKINPAARNEALDLLVMSHVIAHLHGLPRIDWEKPPVWAAPWESNSHILLDGAREPVPIKPVATTASIAATAAAPKKPATMGSFLDKLKK